ncbi:MAG: HEAT repeat domain-containing protein, partial [Planctomycetota bacterium]
LGPPAWDALVTCLDAADKDARGRAAHALLRIDLDRAEQRVWPIALGAEVPGKLKDRCREQKQAVVPHLMKALSCDDEVARANAAWLLGELGHVGAISALRGLLGQDSSASARFQALWALDAVLQAP